MTKNSSASVTNANRLDKYLIKNEKQEQNKKDKQLYNIIERKVKKEKFKYKKLGSRDGTLKECERLFKEGATPEVLIKLEESFREEHEKYYRYYVQCFLPILARVIEQSKKISTQIKVQVISEINKSCSGKYNEQDRRYGRYFENEVDKTIHIDYINNKKFRNNLKDFVNSSNLIDEKVNNILHFIASLERKQKLKFLDTLISVATEKKIVQLVKSKNQEEKIPFQLALINKTIKDRHDFYTTQNVDSILKFLIKFLEYGINYNNLGLFTEELKYLNEQQKIYFCDFLEKLTKSVKKSELKSEIKTRIERFISHAINIQDYNDKYQLHLAIKDKDEKSFKELLRKGADISLKDPNGNNALHHIALLGGKQKVKCVKLISDLLKERKISVNKLDKAIKATNRQGNTPLELALKKKAEKESVEYLSQETIFDLSSNYDNTTKFCAALLQNGANPDSLWLEGTEFHTKKYYLTLRDLKDRSSTPQKAQEKAKELKEKLEEKYHCRTASKKCQSGIKMLGSGIRRGVSTLWCCIDPGRKASVLLVIILATTITTIVTLSCFQGQIATGAALTIIAITGLICLIFTLRLGGISKSINELIREKQRYKDDPLTSKQPENITEQLNFANSNNSADQEVQRFLLNQSEHAESPATRVSYVSRLRQFVSKPDWLTNKFSFPVR